MDYKFNNFDLTMKGTDKIVDDLITKAFEAKEKIIFEQLNELISRGLLVIEETQPVIVKYQEYNTNTTVIKMEQAVRLVPKEFEYIKKLEKDNEELKDKVNNLEQMFEISQAAYNNLKNKKE